MLKLKLAGLAAAAVTAAYLALPSAAVAHDSYYRDYRYRDYDRGGVSVGIRGPGVDIRIGRDGDRRHYRRCHRHWDRYGDWYWHCARDYAYRYRRGYHHY